MSSKILVQDGGRQTIVDIGEEPITIGRDPASRIVIEDRLASRHHGKFFWDGSTFVYEDLGSSNGSLLDGKKVQRISLGDGDAIRIGEAELRVEMPGVLGSGDATPVAEDAPVESQNILMATEPEGARLSVDMDGQLSWLALSSQVVIGRGAEADLRIDDTRVSARHALVAQNKGRWFVKDLDSGNGVVVGNKKIKTFELKDGISFRIGKVDFSAHGLGAVVDKPSTSARSTSTPVAPELVVTRSSNVDVGADSSQGLSTFVFIAILAIVVYSGYGFLKDLAANPDLAISEGDRLVGEGFFEQRDPGPLKDDNWQIVTGEGSIQIVEGENAPQGQKWLEASGESGIDGVFRVQFQDLFEVKAGEGLLVSGRVANRGFDRVGVCVRWFERGGAGDVVVAEDFTALRGNSAWSGVAAEFAPPAVGAGGSARISVVGIGSGAGGLLSDQLVVRTIESQPSPSTTVAAGDSGQEISVVLDDRGVGSLYRGKSEVISDIRISLGTSRPMPWGQLLPSRKEQVVVGDDGSFRLGYEIEEADEKAVIQQFSRSLGWRIASTWSPQRPVPMLLVGKIPARRVGEPVQVFGGKGAGVYHEELSALQACTGTEISLGKGNSQVVISFQAPVQFSIKPDPGGRGVLLVADAGLVPAGGVVDISVSASSEREQAQVQAVYRNIEEVLDSRQEGQAIALIKSARDAFPWRDDLSAKLDLLEGEIEIEIKAATDQIGAVQRDFEIYPGSPAGKFLDQICEATAHRFDGLPVAEKASAILNERKQTAQDARELLSAGRIEQVLSLARSALGKDRNEIARFYFQWVVDQHPASEGADEARQGLKVIAARGN